MFFPSNTETPRQEGYLPFAPECDYFPMPVPKTNAELSWFYLASGLYGLCKANVMQTFCTKLVEPTINGV